MTAAPAPAPQPAFAATAPDRARRAKDPADALLAGSAPYDEALRRAEADRIYEEMMSR